MTIQKTHYADDDTLAHIATLEAELRAARAMYGREMAGLQERLTAQEQYAEGLERAMKDAMHQLAGMWSWAPLIPENMGNLYYVQAWRLLHAALAEKNVAEGGL